MHHHAFLIEADEETGISAAQEWAKRELQVEATRNPDVIVLRHGLFSVADERRVCELAVQAPFSGEYKVVIMTASRAYHEAQNALLKLFEEPPRGTYLFLVLPSLGGLLPTLRSRTLLLEGRADPQISRVAEATKDFLKAGRGKQSAIAKKIAGGKDEEDRRAHRDEAIRIVNDIEALAYGRFTKSTGAVRNTLRLFLNEIAVLRGYLYDRSAPVRMILEHLSLVMPEEVKKEVAK